MLFLKTGWLLFISSLYSLWRLGLEVESWVKSERLRRNMSQYKLAKFIGVTSGLLSSWELGKRELTFSDKNKLKEAFALLDKNFIEGKRPTKRNIVGSAKIKRVPKLNENSWENIDIKYPKSYLKTFSVKQSEKNSKRGPKAIALFSGCGGVSLGFKSAGFNVVGFVEIEESARKIYSANFKDAECLGTDIRKVKKSEIEKWKQKFGHISVLCGGPPCQGFSLAGKRDSNDSRNQLYQNYLKIAKILKPEAIVLENVKLLISMKDTDGELIVHKIEKMFSDIGYDCSYKVLNSENYGVPQSRNRVIFIGYRKDIRLKPIHPEKTHGVGSTEPLTFRDACKDLSSLENNNSCEKDPLHWAINHPKHVIKWLKATPEGQSAHDNPDPELRPPSGYNTTYKRIRWDQPSSTISTNFNMISGCRNVHPSNTRSYTIREAMRCQSFPDDFKIVGKWSDVRKAIGNAVPPLLGKAIAKKIREDLFSK